MGTMGKKREEYAVRIEVKLKNTGLTGAKLQENHSRVDSNNR